MKDRSGAVVVNADVTLRTATQEFTQTTRSDGTFSFTGLDVSSGTLAISAKGFAVSMTEWRAGDNDLAITLQPAMVEQSLDITATRTAILPAGIDDFQSQPDAVSVRQEQHQQGGALATDDKLRNVAEFSLLRRSGSQTANPTSQSVSPRFWSKRSQPRALVLADGIPLNDPFGGWIYWARVPQSTLSQVQLVPGGVSALHGNDAVGGVIDLETKSAIQTDGFVEGSYGNENSTSAQGGEHFASANGRSSAVVKAFEPMATLLFQQTYVAQSIRR